MKIRQKNRPQGFISLGLLGHITAIGLLIVGGQGAYVALKNPDPLEITMTSYSAKQPDAEWMTLKEAQVSLVEAAYKARLGNVSEVFIPVRATGEATDTPVHILLSTNDPAVLAALKEMSQSGTTVQKKVDAASRQAGKLFMQKDITGLTRYGFFYDKVMRYRLAKLGMKLADDFVILNEGAAPDLLMSLIMVGGGLLIWFVMLCSAMADAFWRWRRRRAFYRQRS